MKISTEKSRKRLVLAVHCMTYALDSEMYSKWISDDEVESIGDNDFRIGGEERRKLAATIRRLRKNVEFREFYSAELKKTCKRFAKRPWDWSPKRKYAVVVNRKRTSAKHHKDCAYCGYGYSGLICGACKEVGIDGNVIRGTEARSASTYVKWSSK